MHRRGIRAELQVEARGIPSQVLKVLPGLLVDIFREAYEGGVGILHRLAENVHLRSIMPDLRPGGDSCKNNQDESEAFHMYKYNDYL